MYIFGNISQKYDPMALSVLLELCHVDMGTFFTQATRLFDGGDRWMGGARAGR
jgi:hypothetical protein